MEEQEQEIPAEEVETEEATTSEEEPEDTAAEEPHKQSGIQKRINELTRAKYDAERRAQQLEERLHQVYTKPQVENTTQESPPKEEDFNTYEEYLDERARFVARQEVRTEKARLEADRKAQEKEKAEKTEQEKINSIWNKGMQEHPDFDDTVRSMPVLTKETVLAATESDIGHKILYYLGNHQEEAQKIAQMSVNGQIMAIGRLEVKLKQPPKKTTNAPDPITPVSTTGSNTQVDLADPKTDDETWSKEFRRRRQQRRGF